MAFGTVNGTEIYYAATTGKEPAIIFVHGAGGSSQCWSRQLESLEGNYRAVAVDLPGHSNSQGTLLNDIGKFAEFVAGFAAALGILKFVLAGHSMGGAIAQEFALRCPGRLHGLILMGTGARLRVSPEILSALAGGKIPFQNADHLYGSCTPSPPREEAFRDMQEVPPAVYLADFQACDKYDRIKDISGIKVPTLIVVGDEDVMTPLKYSEFLNARIENSRLRIVKGTGHMCMQEKPEEVTQAINDFMGSLSLP